MNTIFRMEKQKKKEVLHFADAFKELQLIMLAKWDAAQIMLDEEDAKRKNQMSWKLLERPWEWFILYQNAICFWCTTHENSCKTLLTEVLDKQDGAKNLNNRFTFLKGELAFLTTYKKSYKELVQLLAKRKIELLETDAKTVNTNTQLIKASLTKCFEYIIRLSNLLS